MKSIPLVVAAAALAQAQPAAKLSFEVVSVKANLERVPAALKIQPGGRLTITSGTLYQMAIYAYGLKSQFNTPRVTGGPEWVKSARFDVEAMPPAGAITAEQTAAERDSR